MLTLLFLGLFITILGWVVGWVGGWVGEIENKDQLSPTEVEIRTEFGNNDCRKKLTMGLLYY